MKDKVTGHYYKEQLTKAPTPDYQKDFFFVEKILGQKTVKKKKFFLVKYLYYPSKFNEYVPAENMKIGDE
jgi:AAA+ superfamily predicted ATPase